MSKEVVFAGFGGQGVLTAGYLLTEMVMKFGAAVTYMPTYGAEMRGGAASSCVKFDKERVGSPLMENIDILVAMNIAALEAYKELVTPGGILVVNSDIIDEEIIRNDIAVWRVPCQSISEKVGNPRGANLVMLGVVIALSKIGELSLAVSMMKDYFAEKGKGKYEAINQAALEAGYHFVTEQS